MEQAPGIISYQYQILRYRHDVATGEFANVGLVFFEPAGQVLRVEVVDKYRRLSEFFGAISGTALLRTLRNLKQNLQKMAEEMRYELNRTQPHSVTDVTNAVLPKDDNALFFSEVFSGWHFEATLAFEELRERILLRYLETTVERHDDNYAWKHIYKEYFDRYGITEKLRPQVVKTPNDKFEFDKTCQNGALHCFQSLSFDLSDESRIKDKMYRWVGKIAELRQSTEPLNIYLLSALPPKPALQDLLEQKLNIAIGNVSIRLVKESEAAEVVTEVKSKLEAHEEG
ncbi:MAG: DUF3037 domain-containing protein [Saprospiraceae bacterium]